MHFISIIETYNYEIWKEKEYNKDRKLVSKEEMADNYQNKGKYIYLRA